MWAAGAGVMIYSPWYKEKQQKHLEEALTLDLNDKELTAKERISVWPLSALHTPQKNFEVHFTLGLLCYERYNLSKRFESNLFRLLFNHVAYVSV